MCLFMLQKACSCIMHLIIGAYIFIFLIRPQDKMMPGIVHYNYGKLTIGLW